MQHQQSDLDYLNIPLQNPERKMSGNRQRVRFENVTPQTDRN